jgi:uracil phosphoribosyltransferase
VAATVGHELAEEIVVIPIVRAGLGMLEAFMEAIPTAKVGHLGLARDEKTLKAKSYLVSLPNLNAKTQVFILDPMLATGGTLQQAIDLIVQKKVENITYIGLVGSQKGIDLIEKKYPQVKIFLAAIDPQLNPKGFLSPGLGDAGDRLFGESH